MVKKSNLPASFWDKIRDKLQKELQSYGIELIRFNIETPFYLDKEIGKKMAESATMTAEANAKQAIIQRQALVQEAEAVRDAKTNQIKQEQINEAIISAAKAQLAAKKMEAEGIEILARARANELRYKAEVFRDFPKLADYEKTVLTTTALGNAKLIVSYPSQPVEHVLKPESYNTPFSFFSSKKPQDSPIENTQRIELNS